MEQKPLQYWKDIIIVHRRRLHSSAVTNDDQDDNVHGDDVVNDISWISEMPFRTPSGFESSERDRQEDSLFLTPPPSDRKPIKREFDDGLSPQEVNALYDDPDTEEFRERLKPGKRLKVETTPTRGVYPIKHVERTEPGKHDHGRNVKIYVENPSKIIVGREEEATQSPLLKKLISYDLSEGWSIMSPALSRFDSKAFEAVVEFLKTAEYTPRFLDENKASRRLENITTQSAKAAHVLNSRILYCIAGKIELQAMQNPILRKLKVLSPYPPSEFITIAGLIFQQGSVGDDEEIRQLLLKYMAEHYWQLQKKEPRQFMEVKTFFPELDASVTTRRAKGTKGEVALIKIEDE